MMNKECEIVRDILPLYVDDVCSPSSREIIEGHLKTCPDCAAYLEDIRASEAESALKDEKSLVIRDQARRFKRRSAAAGSVISALFMVPILICLIVNLTSGRTLDWFYIVVAAMLVVASLTVVPVMVPENKLFWTLCAFTASTELLLGVICLVTRGTWFGVAGSAVLFGLAVCFLPWAIRAKPLRKWIGNRSKVLIVICADALLFLNMMTMIMLHAGSANRFWPTVGVTAGITLGVLYVMKNRRDEK
jgi:predicted anti-sigma-YlaC factor YlaD